jgi:transposase
MNQIANSASKTDLENLDKEVIIELLLEQKKKTIELEETNATLLHYLKLAQAARFGSKSEKVSDDEGTPMLPGIGQVFDEASVDVEPKKPAKKRAAQGGRKPLPDHLPRDEVTHDIEEHKKVCPCGHPLKCIGKEESEQLEFIPAQLKVIKNVRLKYGCKACEDTMILAKMPPQALPKTMAGPGLLAHILVSKYDDHLPLYRQAEMWERAGVDLDCTTMGRWVMSCGDLLMPLVDLMKQDIMASGSVQADETGVQVMNEKGRKNKSKSYMWVFKTAGDKNSKIVYHYSPTRNSDVISSFLSGFEGYLQSDGYTAYTKFAAESPHNIINLGCWAHARRKFVEITKVAAKKGVAFGAVKLIAELYKIERQAKADNLSFEEIQERRQKESKPILEELKKFLLDHQDAVPPQSLLGKAISYTLKNWEHLTVYLERGDLEIDNNATERCVKPFAVGRKNWYFKGCVKGANASAAIYSLIETAKSHGHNPYNYLKDIFSRLPQKIAAGESLEDLLPYNWKPQVL